MVLIANHAYPSPVITGISELYMVVANGAVGGAISAHSFIFPYSTLHPFFGGGESERGEKEREP